MASNVSLQTIPDSAANTGRRFLLIFIPIALALCLVFYLFYRQQTAYEIRVLQTEQRDYVLREKRGMEAMLGDVVADTNLMAQSKMVRGLAEEHQASDLQALGRFLIVVAHNKPNYAQLRFLDRNGMELVRVDRDGGDISLVPGTRLQDKSHRYYVREGLALKPGQLYISRFDLNVEQEQLDIPFKPMLRFVAPVGDPKGDTAGLLVVNYLGDGILQNLRAIKPNRGRLEMVDQQGYWLLGPKPEDEWGFMIAERSGSHMDITQPEVWSQIEGKREGQFWSGQEMITFVQARPPENVIGQQGWYLLARLPRDVLDQAPEANSRFVILVVLLLATALFSLLLARSQIRRQLAEQKLQKDAENKNALKSLLSLRLDGDPLEVAMGKALDIVLSVSWLSTLHMGGIFISEEGKEPVLRLVAQRDLDPEIRAMCAVVPYGHCLCGLAAASGKTQFADHVDHRHHNSFPGMTDHGHYNIPLMKGADCKGVLLLYLTPGKLAQEEEMVFLRSVGDVLAGILDSNEKELAIRESEARLNALVDTAVEGIVTIDQQGNVLSLNRAAENIFGYQASEIIGKPVDLLQPESLEIHHHEFIRRYLETGEARVIGIGREVTGRCRDGRPIPLYLSVSEVRQGGKVIFTGILHDISELKEAQRQIEQARELAENTNRQLVDKQFLLDQDLVAAAGIQQALLPSQYPDLKSLELAWHFTPSQRIGGDMLNVTRLSPDHIRFYMLDVSGHGVPAALVTVSVHEMLRTSSGHVVQQLEDGSISIIEPRLVADLLDREYPLERFDKYFTIFYGVLNVRTGTLLYTNAGHPPPLVVRPNGDMVSLNEGGTVIGMNQPEGFEQAEYQMHPGDRIFIYTDGLIEHGPSEGVLYGETRLRKALNKGPQADLSQWIDTVVSDVMEFGERQSPVDDISILAAKFTGRE